MNSFDFTSGDIHFQLRARPEYREPRPNFEAKELAQPIRRPQFDFVNAKPRQHHEQEVILRYKNFAKQTRI